MGHDDSAAGALRSGKSHKDENFPVASRIIHPRHRALILAFYNFVRTGDDISDHADLSDVEKLDMLSRLADDLEGDPVGRAPLKEAVVLRHALAERGMEPRHALDVLEAFRMDVTKLRYENWDELIHYCEYSAMPVGRFVLDVHGEDRKTWAASDKLCAALQINNHLQDCAKDFKSLNRVYLPRDAIAAHGVDLDMLRAPRATPQLLACIRDLAGKNAPLLRDSQTFADDVADRRLGCEIAVIQIYAERILQMLEVRDPLSERVHLSKWDMLGLTAKAVLGSLYRRDIAPRFAPAAAR
jgi:hydroxysqualene synthase